MGNKSCEIDLLINLANTTEHFVIYEIIMKHIATALVDKGLIEGKDFEIRSLDDISFSKESFAKNEKIINEISDEYFPIYAKTNLIPEEEPTYNDFHLEVFKLHNNDENGNIIENDYTMVVTLNWGDEEPPENTEE